MLIRDLKENPIRIGIILFILVMTILNFVMIDELFFIVSRLQIEIKVQVPKTDHPHEKKAPGNLDEAAKDRMDLMRGAGENQVHILFRNRRNNQRLDR